MIYNRLSKSGPSKAACDVDGSKRRASKLLHLHLSYTSLLVQIRISKNQRKQAKLYFMKIQNMFID